jgi:hypothetical protein
MNGFERIDDFFKGTWRESRLLDPAFSSSIQTSRLANELLSCLLALLCTFVVLSEFL